MPHSNRRVMSDVGIFTEQCSLSLTDYSTVAGQESKCWIRGKLQYTIHWMIHRWPKDHQLRVKSDS